MLELLYGKAGTGKTSAVINRINDAVKSGQGQRMLIVPEQYSHEAERELCRLCGDTLSLYAEVFSFTGLARRIMSQCGGGAGKYLDKGGRLLCLSAALGAVGSRLEVYSSASRKAEVQAMLLSAIDELKTACISSEMLFAAAESCPGELGKKLCDLALINEAFEAVVANGRADPTDRLTILALQIPESGIDSRTYIYIDGFIDFTAQQQNVIKELLRKGANVTVCLTIDAMDSDNEVFSLSRIAAGKLIADAKELGAEIKETKMDAASGKNAQLAAFSDNMFSYTALNLPDEGRVFIGAAESMAGECEFAAAKAIELVRETGCRWRDIAVAVRGFGDYLSTLDSVFRHYEVPLFTAKRSDMLEKPIPALIGGAYEIINGGWETDDVISYMRTGLTGLSREECDMLEGYIFKWQIKGSAWLREKDWYQHPDGFNREMTDEVSERLREINSLRRRLAEPLKFLSESGNEAHTAAGQAAALAGFLERIKLPEQLEAHADALRLAGRETLAEEYGQLWSIIVSALEQSHDILGDSEADTDSFGRLFMLMLSEYDVGTIPVSLDRVSAGDFDRMRRRNIKHLIVLGASDDRLPQGNSDAGIFSEEERRRLLEADIDLGGAGESELWREFSLIYNTLTLPSETLSMIYSVSDSEGNTLRPSFILNRAQALFSLKNEHIDLTKCRLQARNPALTVAAHSLHAGNSRNNAAAEFFRAHAPERFSALEQASELSRGRLSPAAVESLYGRRIRLSASRIDKFASCKFAYFCQYGLKAKPYEPAAFKPPEIGTFIHEVLENTARAVKEKGGFSKVTDAELTRLADLYVHEFIHTELNDFNEKSSRFIYLFNRLTKDVNQIVLDMAAELRNSDFEPLDFELDFAEAKDIPPIVMGEGESSMTLTGVADRVDGWLHDGKMYIRIADYKTGHKKFSLTDVYYGMGLQMLLYLFAIEEGGQKHFKHEIVPAGIMYVPARNDITNLSTDTSDENAEKERLGKIKRSGMVLDDPELIEAWEKSGENVYIPIRFDRSRKPTADSLVSLEKMGRLSRHIKQTLGDMSAELKRGCIAADPFYRNQQESACAYCDYFNACHFSDGENGESFRYISKLDASKVWELIERGESDG